MQFAQLDPVPPKFIRVAHLDLQKAVYVQEAGAQALFLLDLPQQPRQFIATAGRNRQLFKVIGQLQAKFVSAVLVGDEGGLDG